MTTLWDENGEEVSTFQVEDEQIWMIIEQGIESTGLLVFKTEQFFFHKLVDTIRKDRLKEAVHLVMKEKKYVLREIPWEAIARRAIKGRL